MRDKVTYITSCLIGLLYDFKNDACALVIGYATFLIMCNVVLHSSISDDWIMYTEYSPPYQVSCHGIKTQKSYVEHIPRSRNSS